MTSLATRWRLKTIQRFDRLRLRRLRDRHPGIVLDPETSTNFASSHFELGPGARLEIGPRVYTERRWRGVHFAIGEGARVEIGADTWLRSDIAPVLIFAFPGASIRIGGEGFLNGCHLSAKESIEIGERVWIGMGSRVLDADQHDLDADRPERVAPIRIGNHCWIAADVTVLRGVEIGEQSVVGTRSIVTKSLPAHTLAIGSPAEAKGAVGDRTRVSI
ncbi:MAG: acyltransferase [Deltaproteobacteria bacterium]|jgi:acetyltransferase-like isoleucine patch superfamily enzyme|nr:acyltransferase [Deltaproteobacteria bacterium]